MAAVILGLAVHGTVADDTATATPPSRLAQLVAGLADAPLPVRADLAWVALSELATVYREEADRARQDLGRRPANLRLRRWIAGVEALAAELSLLAEHLGATTPVALVNGPDHSVQLALEGRFLAIHSPRIGEQAAFARRIVERFCRLNACDAYLSPRRTRSPAESDLQPEWRFAQGAGPVCSVTGGLEFQFGDLDDLGGRRARCARVVGDLDTLIRAIRESVDHGVRVDWERLALHGSPPQSQHLIVLNSDGDALWSAVPALAATPALLEQLRPWLAARVAGHGYPLVVLRAEHVLAPVRIPEP